MAELKAILHRVQPDIEKIEQTMRCDIDMLALKMDDFLIEILRYGLFSGGKRFRPLLAVISSRLCNILDDDIYKLAIAFEYLHLATLFHDDVIDQAEIRRGKPSICKQFGVSAAILAGDFLHARSMQLIGKYGRGSSLEIFCNATGGMVDGEFLQLKNASNFNQSEEDYFRAIDGKTALLISATTEIGALQGRSGPEQRKALKKYGQNLGFGFQIIDDLLDYVGDEGNTGKSIGNDLVEGKMTLPLILTLSMASAEHSKKLIDILENPTLRSESFDTVFSIIEKYDGFRRTRKKAEECIEKAITCLDIFHADSQQDVEALKGLAYYAIERQR